MRIFTEVSSLAYVIVKSYFLEADMIAPNIITTLSILFTLQGVLSLYWMLYAWEDARRADKDKTPKKFDPPARSFSAIIPARNETKVIASTLKAVASIDYPKDLCEIVVVCREDDPSTIEEVQRMQVEISSKHGPNVLLVILDDLPINKPHSLNWGLKSATKDVVVIFDAEDQPHPEVYSIVNTVMNRQKCDVVQCGVQLMNYDSSWFSTLNVLEYFFWFKSALHFFSAKGVVPLGGNTVFFKREWLIKIGGWDENCLTEDADIGIRLSSEGAKIRVVYDEKHATREETPPTLKSFIKQRTRWNQGFLQVFFKWQWLKVPGINRKLLGAYMLLLPELQAIMFILMPITLFAGFYFKLPPGLALFTFIPLLLLILQISLDVVGIYEFTKDYRLKFSIFYAFKIFIFYWVYLAVLGYSSFRGVGRFLTGRTNWEKTRHINAHRVALEEVLNEKVS